MATRREFRQQFREFAQEKADDTSEPNKVRHPFLFLLVHPRAMRQAQDETAALYDKQRSVLAQKGGQMKGVLQDLLQWFLDNSDKIIAIIQKIIAMFVKK